MAKERSKALVTRKDTSTATAERQRRHRAMRDAGLLLVPNVVVDEAGWHWALLDFGWITREDLDDPKKIGKALSDVFAHMIELDSEGNFIRMPMAPDDLSRVTALEIELCYPSERKH